jgi:hypothetical protein
MEKLLILLMGIGATLSYGQPIEPIALSGTIYTQRATAASGLSTPAPTKTALTTVLLLNETALDQIASGLRNASE